MPDYAYHLALLYIAGYAFQHRHIRLIAKVDVLKFYIALYIKLCRVIYILDIALLVKYLKHLCSGNCSIGKVPWYMYEPVDRLIKHCDVCGELYQLA